MRLRRLILGATAVAGLWVVGRLLLDAQVGAVGPTRRRIPMQQGPRRRARAGRLRLVVSMLLWPLVLFGWPWDPIFDAGDAIWNKIKDKVKDLIDQVVGFVLSAIGLMGQLILRLGIVGLNVLKTLEDIAGRIIPTVLDTVSGWIDASQRLVLSVVDYAIALANDAAGLARDLFGRVEGMIWDALRAAINAFWRDVVAPIANAVAHVWDFVFPYVRDVISTFWRDVVGPIERLARATWDAASEALSLARKFWAEIWPVLAGAWHFLVFVATHPFTWWIDLAEQAFRAAPGWVTRNVLDAVEASSDQIDQRMARWIAG